MTSEIQNICRRTLWELYQYTVPSSAWQFKKTTPRRGNVIRLHIINTDLENDLDGLKVSSLMYSIITYLKPLCERSINSLRNIMNLLFVKSDFIIKFRRKRKNRIKAGGRVIKPQSQIFGKKDLKLFLQSTIIWKTHVANDMELTKIRKKTNFLKSKV